MASYEHILFDLDRTLWDFERNSEEVLQELFERFRLDAKGLESFDEFLKSYRGINADYWRAHREGKVGKDELRYERFHHTLLRNGVSDRSLADRLAEAYLRETPSKTLLMNGALELLDRLAPHYRLHLLTNGYADTQLQKVEGTGMEHYLELIITSDRAGTRKPDPAFFEHALICLEAKKEEVLMVGDDVEADIIGAQEYGIDQVLFDQEGKKEDPGATYRIRTLNELMAILPDRRKKADE